MGKEKWSRTFSIAVPQLTGVFCRETRVKAIFVGLCFKLSLSHSKYITNPKCLAQNPRLFGSLSRKGVRLDSQREVDKCQELLVLLGRLSTKYFEVVSSKALFNSSLNASCSVCGNDTQ